MMGGIHTDIMGKTPIEGLYAAGETACVSINGANRLGSNSLTECLVFGARSGKAASEYVQSQSAPSSNIIEALARDEQKRIDQQFLNKRNGKERIADIRSEMQMSMEEGIGVYRSEESMKKTCNKLADLRGRFANIKVEDTKGVFNTEITSALELDFMLDIAQAVAHCALDRKESRGSHTRTDFPKRDDDQYLKHSLAYRTQGEPKVDYLPVAITRWQPEERKY